MTLLCPICGGPIEAGERSWRCAEGHCFDVARQGYVNLLPVQQKHSLHPGDTPAQVHARRRFLSAGFYAPIAEAVCALLGPAARVLDVGCGEACSLMPGAFSVVANDNKLRKFDEKTAFSGKWTLMF